MFNIFKSHTKPFKTLLKQPDFDWITELKTEHPNTEIYLVGGIVRDIILKKESHDIDFVVRNIEATTLKTWLTKHGIVNLVGKSFGVFKFTPTKSTEMYPAFDIALPRTEHALGTGGYKDVETQSNPNLPIKDDLARRDFTINALAYNIADDCIIDEWNGLNDLKNKTIRCVGEPHVRFQEDYLRILRALRFACQLTFTIEPTTKKTITEMLKHINDSLNNERVVPQETIAKEFMKSLIADPILTLDIWDEVQAWEHVLPELLSMKESPQHHEFHAEGDVWTHTRLALQKLYEPECNAFIKKNFPAFAQDIANPRAPEVVLATLLHDIAKPDTIQTPEKNGVDRIRNHEHEKIGAEKARTICERMKLSSPDEVGANTDQVVWLVKNHLIAGNPNIQSIKPTTIEKYFFSDTQRGANLLTLIYADGAATLSPSGIPALKALSNIITRINDILSLCAKKTAAMKLPKPIVSGDDIMKHFNLKPGKQIGELLHIAREAQLSGLISTQNEAYTLLKKNL